MPQLPPFSVILSVGLCWSTVCIDVLGQDASATNAPARAAELEFFEKKVRPVLANACFSCHSREADKGKGGLFLDARADFMKGGENGPVVVAGRPEMSRLIEAIRWQNPDLQMPPKKALRPDQIDDLVAWVSMGAPWPAVDPPVTSRRSALEVTDKDRQHWSFRPIQRPAVPRGDKVFPNPIDAFIGEKLSAQGLEPSPPAERQQWVRRVYFDLTGLPPTPEEMEAFIRDASPDAEARLIERLLASNHYGEKWGRHWLDLVRFAETNSYERDGAKPHAWRFRDYVIRAFNADKPYDRFIRELLAGDELEDGGDDGIIATGYFRLGIWDDEPADRELARYDMLDDIVATTGQVFLGLTIDCARCHDHKIDPISQRDYYALLSFFQNIHHYKNGGPTDEVPLSDLSLATGNGASDMPKALAVTEGGAKPPDTHILLRGSPENKGDKVEPAFLKVLNPPVPRIRPAASGKTAGRRRALADWIASADNPLTARVLVNRVWQHHFGRGLVRTTSDFGVQGQPPTHPELLDWLASEFIGSGWSLKALHRTILSSEAYRRSSRPTTVAMSKDPANDFLSHFDMRRLTAEELRDAILSITGPLNRRMYGPGVYVTIPKEVLAGQSAPGSGWGKSEPGEQLRRSVYIHVKRSLLTPLLLGFDLAEPDRSTPVRFATTQPTQALAMLNSEFLNERAAAFSARIRTEFPGSDRAQVARALNLVVGRAPTDAEVQRGLSLLETLESSDRLSPEAAMNTFCLLALNLNEFLYLD